MEITKAIAYRIIFDARESIQKVSKAIEELTKDKPFELFTKENVPEDLYDLPIGYNVNKYSEYDQGAIMKVEGTNITLFFTGEMYGQTFETELEQISFDNQIQLLSIIHESM